MKNKPIGVFDSGVGGLSVLSRLIELLPNEKFIYFGDTIHLPYGNKTKEQLVDISSSIFDFFEKKGVKAVVMACNTTSAIVYDILKSKYSFRIYPIVQSVSKYIADKNYQNIGVFATLATVNSGAYKKEIQKFNKNIKVFEYACPQWVSIVEKSLQKEKNSVQNIKSNVEKMLQNNIEKIILGCTHYPYLLNILSEFAPADMFIDPAEQFAKFISQDLQTNNLINDNIPQKPVFFVSSNHTAFENTSSLFYKVDKAHEISLEKMEFVN